jgi:hypothetical protein
MIPDAKVCEDTEKTPDDALDFKDAASIILTMGDLSENAETESRSLTMNEMRIVP